ncbi:MAG: TlpA family protein disulfide reductase [Bacteroidota bacterium]
MNYHNILSKYGKAFLLLLVILTVICFEYYIGHNERSVTPLKAGQRFPSIRVLSLQGKEEPFDARIRRRMVLVIFSTTCIHCLDEMKFWDEYASEVGDSVDVNAISADDPESTASFVKEHQIRFPVFTRASKDVADTLHVRSVPMIFFIDVERILRKVIVGNQPNERVIDQLGEFLREPVIGDTERY